MSSSLDLFTLPAAIKNAAKSVAVTVSKSATPPSDTLGPQGKGGEANDSFRQSMARESQQARPRESSGADKVTSARDNSSDTNSHKVSTDQSQDKVIDKSAVSAEGKAEKTTAETATETTTPNAIEVIGDLAVENTEATVPTDLMALVRQPLVSHEANKGKPTAILPLKAAATEPLLRNPLAINDVPLPVTSGSGIEIVGDGGEKPHPLLGVGADTLTNNKSEPAHLFRAGLFKTTLDTAQAVPLEKADVNMQPGLKLAEMPLTPIEQGAPVTRSANFAKMLQLDNGQILRLDTAAANPVVEAPESRGSGSLGSGHATSPLSAFNIAFNSATTDAVGARMQVPVNISFGQPQWANMVAERSAWLFSQNISNADLMLDPPELGRMSVHIQVHNNEQASVTFTSANHSVRDALDQTTQRLRELLAEQGLDLVNVDVSDRQPSGEKSPQNSAKGGSGGPLVSDGEAGAGEGMASGQIIMNVGIDHYV